MKKQSINNYKKAKLLNFLIYSFLVISVLIPLLVIFVFNTSELAQILINYPLIILFLIIVQIYFFSLGSYFSEIKIDKYIINIHSSRTNSKDELLDIKHSMLKNYFIKKSIFSWNTIIYINFMKKKDTFIRRKFYFSLLNKNEKKNIISSLDYIINNNEWNRKHK